MIAGFAMVAYPAEYGQSGVMTFIVSHNGKIYQKDLGKNSAQVGAKMTLSIRARAGKKSLADRGSAAVCGREAVAAVRLPLHVGPTCGGGNVAVRRCATASGFPRRN